LCLIDSNSKKRFLARTVSPESGVGGGDLKDKDEKTVVKVERDGVRANFLN